MWAIIHLFGAICWLGWGGYFIFADKPTAPPWFIAIAFIFLALNSARGALSDS